MKSKKKNKLLRFLILLLIIIIGVIVFLKNKPASNEEESSDSTTTITESEVVKTDIVNSVSNSNYVETALEEKKELHATYYFNEIYVSENQYVSAGENLLQYTNGTYMTAPYNCVISEISVPDDSGDMCTNEHYITLQSTDTLKISLNVDENEIDKIYLGQSADIELTAFPDKEITGYVTNIDNQATYDSNGSTFNIDVEFQNDGDILLGMSAKSSVILEEAQNVIAVATEAIEEQNGKMYVTVKLDDDTTKEVEVETGIANDAYTEIKSGLNEGDIVIIEKEESNSNRRMNGEIPGGGQMGPNGEQGDDFNQMKGDNGEQRQSSGGESK